MTMTLVSTVNFNSGSSYILEFNSIPATGTDLLLVLSLKNTADNNSPLPIIINGSYSGYSNRVLQGTGSAVASTNAASQNVVTISPSSMVGFTNTSIYFPNYAGNTDKSFSIDAVTEANASFSLQRITAGLWANTAAITSLSIGGATFAQYSSASLYTITKGSGGATVS